ncbi:nucleoporin Nup186/Nup192/Nup205 [Tricharina praecox]|uniref:nucleoporin Nup186/Nup192/Nup205 n=1 Tax=Tricharina praecox TaxID=43433 RepID=UPI00221E792A|nr:nucleoporin Nup186/Nup192/Nup205 [Tricharina praecox]KAI5843714.1 nucleoporin Nup186/Nup192/Nup205 [Tricharina praecox]
MASPTSLAPDTDDELQLLADTLEVVPKPNEVEPEGLRQLLDDRIEELRQLLDTLGKNDASRNKLKEGKLNIGGEDFQLNEAFQQEATQLSDDFNMDEIAAAKLLQRGDQKREELDRSALQSAKFLYHTRRKNILQSIRLILSYVGDVNVGSSDTRHMLNTATEKLLERKDGRSFADRCISAMVSVRQAVQQLRDKEKHAHTLGMAPDPGLKEDLDLQLRFLRNQHEMLAVILYHLVKLRRTGVSELRRLLDTMRTLDRYDVFTAHHILPLFASITFLCAMESPLSFEETIQLHKEIAKTYTENHWPLRYCQAGIYLWWLSEFNGLCNDPPAGHAPSKASLDYYQDIQNPAKVALTDGGLELVMGLSADIAQEQRLNSSKEDLHRFLQTRVPPLEDVAMLLPDFRGALTGQFELFIDSIIANLASLLQTIKTAEEEDDIMNLRTYDYELERFFLIVHYTFDGRPEMGMTFWGDPEGNLFGFLRWAAKNQTPFMVATFCYMLASISYGTECAAAAHKFLIDETNVGALNRNRRGESLNWTFIFKHVRVYLAELGKRQQALVPNPAYRMPPPPVESTEPAPHLSMELDGMLRLTGQLAADCPEARQWLRGNTEYNIVSGLFELLNLQASTQLWDSIFAAITALLTDKDEAFRDEVWKCLDDWAMGSPAPPSSLQLGASTAVATPFAQGGSENLDLVIRAVHPAEAFTRLLAKLVEPYEGAGELRDAVPFPENLGSNNRMSGMVPYVDFIMRTIFNNTTVQNLPRESAVNSDRVETVSEKLLRVQYRRFRPALQLSCLQFMYDCLASFNDDLLDLAHKGFVVDGGLRASSLLTYTKLHPFGRVMEHILTEKCLNVLFEILQLGVEDLYGNVEPSNAVVDTIWYTIRILDLAIQMQPTYLRVVRPFIKQDEGARRANIIGNSFEKLEKAVHYRLDTIVNLGLYVGASQHNIVLDSIKLLEKLTISPEFTTSTEASYGRPSSVNRALGAVEQSPESKRILFNFIQQWQFPDENQLENWGFPLKMPILRFLDNSLAAQPNSFTLAHLVLGFGHDTKAGGIELSMEPGGVGSGVSLLHQVLYAAMEAKECVDENGALTYIPAYCELKHACFSILQRLWSAPSTSGDVLYILRMNKFFLQGFLSESTITPATLWGIHPNRVAIEPTPQFFEHGACAFADFLERRTALFNYTALEIRQLSLQGASTMVQRYLSTLLGTTMLENQRVSNVHILDLLDFLEFTFPERTKQPQVQWIRDINLSAFEEDDASGAPVFNVDKVVEFLQIKKNERFRSAGIVMEYGQHQQVDDEIEVVRRHLNCENLLRRCRRARIRCLGAWSTLVIMMLEDCDMERMSKTGFILQALQAVLPKLELFSVDDVDAAQVLSELAHSLISHLPFDATTFGVGRGSDLANDRLYQLFRVSLRSIQSPSATAKLREDFYNIALQYLNGMAAVSGQNPGSRRHSTQTVKASGDKLLEVVCNDAYSGDGRCKVVSLLLLEALAAVAAEEGSSFVIETLVKQNFLVVLVDSIKTIAQDVESTRTEDIKGIMIAFKAATGFLIRISQSRSGAAQVINSGLFQALRECRLFSLDPDLGLQLEQPLNLQCYYELLLEIMRVVVSCILSRGPQNRQAIDSVKLFLLDNRNLALTIFKRHAGIGGAKGLEGAGDLKTLVDMFVLLYSLTEFIDDGSENY